MIKRLISFIAVISICIALLCACKSDITDTAGQGNQTADSDRKLSAKDAQNAERFETLIDGIFEKWVTSDTLTLQYFIAEPENMGLTRPSPTYGYVMTSELYSEEKEYTAYIEEELSNIRYESLSPDRQIIYDIICRSVELSKILEEKEDYAYYTGYIRPTTGLQVQLPVLLAEFRFYTAEDIDIYLELLADTIRYFDDVIAFERERAARGYFLSDANIDEVIAQLESFLDDREDSFLISVVEDKIDAFASIDNAQREEYKRRNRTAVEEYVFPAYENLLAAMRSLRGVGGNPGGLASLPNGENVAHAFLRQGSGSDRTVEEFGELISNRRQMALSSVRMILAGNNELAQKYSNGTLGQIEHGTPEEYLAILKNTAMQQFPPVKPIDYVIYQVHESLQEHISPAFFLNPAIDKAEENVIYINPAAFGNEPGDNFTLFTILAHEGYPGHMYEKAYFRQTASPHPIRLMLSHSGYSEGWATYAEFYSYDYAGLDDMEAQLLREIYLYFMFLQSNIDIGVNLLGWTRDDVAMLLFIDLSITDSDMIDNYYNAVTGKPFNSSMYALGYIEITMLRDETEIAMGDNFSLESFHTGFLSFGPAPFSLIRRNLW